MSIHQLSNRCRCPWPGNSDIMMAYHDEEWGVPVHNDKRHFEFLTLDAFQAGLTWLIILKKREAFRKAFANFDVQKVAGFNSDDVERLVQNADIVRNRMKIVATINNAKAFIEVQKEFGSFDAFIWQFTGGKTLQNQWQSMSEIPAETTEAKAMSKALKKRRFSFVGPTICYAYMQAAGMVNDHVTDCFRYHEVGR
jgi:DNA-3-methyladenine glycosylase I